MNNAPAIVTEAQVIQPPANVVQRSDSTALMQIIERAAMSSDFDVAKLEKLLELKERWDKTESRKAFDAALSSAKGEIKPIFKGRKVDFTSSKGRTNYDYEDLSLIAEHIDPILGKYGLSYRYRPEQKGTELYVTCIVSHRDGHSEETTLKANNDETGNKNTIQSVGSAATYLQRYTLKLALGLSATNDDDGRGAGAPIEYITESQAADIRAFADEVKADRTKFLEYMGVESVDKILKADHKKAINSLEAKRKANNEAVK